MGTMIIKQTTNKNQKLNKHKIEAILSTLMQNPLFKKLLNNGPITISLVSN